MSDATKRSRDAWIALRCRLGEPAGFEALVETLERPLLYYLMKFLRDESSALDALQEVWVKVFRKIGALRDPASLRPWVYRIARGTALNMVRSDQARDRAEEAAAEPGIDGDDEPEFSADDAAALHDGLDALPRKQREALVLHFLDDLSIDEIAELVGAPGGTVKSRIFNAKKALRRLMEKRS